MAGRGRGRGASMSFNPTQLGFAPGEKVPGAVLQPPPTYPTPDNRPLPIDLGEAGDYLLFLKQKHSAFMRDAPSFLEQVVIKRDIQRYADRYQAVTIKSASGGRGPANETYYPEELRKKVVRKKRKQPEGGSSVPSKIARKAVDVNGRLEQLEQREKAAVDVDEMEGDVVEGGEEGKEAEGEGEGEVSVEEFDEEDLDEEMDDGTDYINSYFDNGEDYGDDEDDNLDDGPTY